MARTFQFDVGRVVEQLDRILQMELAAVIYYTHYSFMIYGHARIPITSWLRDNATESLTHAQEAGEMIMRLHKRPAHRINQAGRGWRGALSRITRPRERQVRRS
jgi:bacterioferritin